MPETMPMRLETILHPSKTRVDKLVWTPSQTEIDREERWIAKEIERVGIPWLENLALDAARVRKHTYSPYSNYAVGAAMLDIAGETHTGQNIETATYSEASHAEEQAMKNPIHDGIALRLGRAYVRAVAVAHKGDTSPCGRCRQIMKEFTGKNALVVVADPEGEIRRVTSLKILLPDAFGPQDLGIK